MTTALRSGGARAVADIHEGTILATVDIASPPERVFRALTSDEITHWWGSDNDYRTTEWSGDVRVGGRWRASGRGPDGTAFTVEGEYLEVDPPRKVVQTWKPTWDEGRSTTLTYQLDAVDGGTRLTVRHEGFKGRPESCEGHAAGWTKVLGWLGRHAAPAPASYFLCRLIPPRPTFVHDMTPAEGAVMQAHVAYWTQHLKDGKAILFGPVLDPKGGWGLGIVAVRDDAELSALQRDDPTIQSRLGFSYESYPMAGVVR